MSGDSIGEHEAQKGRRKNGQFMPGTSGNPKGRPQKSRSTRAIFERMLNSKVPVKLGNKVVQLSVIEAIAERVKREALAGPMRGMEKGIALAEKYSAAEPQVDQEEHVDLSRLTDEDLMLYGQLAAKAEGLDWADVQQEVDRTIGGGGCSNEQ